MCLVSYLGPWLTVYTVEKELTVKHTLPSHLTLALAGLFILTTSAMAQETISDQAMLNALLKRIEQANAKLKDIDTKDIHHKVFALAREAQIRGRLGDRDAAGNLIKLAEASFEKIENDNARDLCRMVLGKAYADTGQFVIATKLAKVSNDLYFRYSGMTGVAIRQARQGKTIDSIKTLSQIRMLKDPYASLHVLRAELEIIEWARDRKDEKMEKLFLARVRQTAAKTTDPFIRDRCNAELAMAFAQTGEIKAANSLVKRMQPLPYRLETQIIVATYEARQFASQGREEDKVKALSVLRTARADLARVKIQMQKLGQHDPNWRFTGVQAFAMMASAHTDLGQEDTARRILTVAEEGLSQAGGGPRNGEEFRYFIHAYAELGGLHKALDAMKVRGGISTGWVNVAQVQAEMGLFDDAWKTVGTFRFSDQAGDAAYVVVSAEAKKVNNVTLAKRIQSIGSSYVALQACLSAAETLLARNGK